MNQPDFESVFQRVAAFQVKQFPNQSVHSKLVHLKREVDELIQAPDDAHEWADCLLLILGAASKAGFTPETLLRHADAKMEINESRSWGEPDADGIHHHL